MTLQPMPSRPDGPPLLAVTAVAGRFPGAADIDGFWALLRDGREGLTRFTDEELDARGVPAVVRRHRDYVPVGGLIEGQEMFDTTAFGLTDAEAALMDPQHRLFLETAWQALERSGHGGGVGVEAVGVFAGAAHSAYLTSNLAGRWDPTGGGRDPLGSLQTAIATQADYLPLQVAYRLGLTGPAMNITTTCSTSLVAVHAAAQSLLAGECDMAVAGGVSLIVPQGHGYRYVPEGIFAVDGRVRPFCAKGSGVVYSQGVGAVVLRRLDEALADGDPVLAVLHGSAVNNDGADKAGFTAPSLRGQARVIAEALAVAGLAPSDVGYLEAHGTGTRLGDPIEVAALRTAFGHADTTTSAWCGLGSVKSNIGHANSAAGIASFIKTVLALHHRTLPASLHAHPLNEQLGLGGSPFAVVTETRAWDTAPHAGVSSFGIGGTNAHVLLGPAPPRLEPVADQRPQVLVYSAKDPDALQAGTHVAPDGDLADVAHTLQSGRTHLPWRAAVIAGQNLTPRKTAQVRAQAAPRVVFLFPGGGSQYAGMAAGLYAHEPVFAACVDECAGLFRAELGTDVRTVIHGDEPAVDSAAVGLPALFTASVATARLLSSWGVQPDVLLGHSLGEYAAAVVSGALDLPDAVRLVAVRSLALAGAAGGGAMLAVPLPQAQVEALLAEHHGVDLAAVNSPDACVVSGPGPAIDALVTTLTCRGTEPARLQLDSAAHSRLIDPALPAMRAAARAVRAGRPAVTTVSSLTGTRIDTEFADPEHWVRQLREPVRFSAALSAALAEPVPTVVVQVGPGAALVAAARGHAVAHLAATITTFTKDDDLFDLAATRLAAGQLWTHGVPVDFPALHRPGRRRTVAPGYAFQRRRMWIDPSPAQLAADDVELLQVPLWRQEPSLPSVTDLGGRWIVLGDTDGAVGAALRSSGAEMADDAGPVDGVVVVVDRLATSAQARQTILGHGTVAALIAARDPRPGLLLQVTVAGCRVESNDLPAPATAAARALPRVIAQETPGLLWRTLDVTSLQAAGHAVVAELADLRTRRSVAEVAVRGTLRCSSAMTPWPIATPTPTVRPGSTALILGGLGDVGLTIADHLAGKGMKVVITSRTGTRQAGLRALTDRGHDVSVRVLDAGDDAATRALLAELAGSATLDLVVHAAGVVATEDLPPMRQIGPDHVDGHVHAKAHAALVLRAAIEALPPAARPRTVVLMSSAGTLVGGIGTGPYSASNGFLNGLAEQSPADGTRWVSVVWDAWKVGPLGTEREVNLDFALDAATGMRALDAVLAACEAGTAPPVVAVSTTDLAARMRAAQRPATPAQTGTTGALSGVEAVVAQVWSELFGAPVTSSDADFFALGGHSLIATRMLAGLAERYRTRLSLRDLLARPTVAGLAETIAAGSPEQPADPATTVRIGTGTAADGTFAMTRVQHAYWMGRSGGYRFGDTACHFALEYDCPGLDLERYEQAWNKVIARHPMLRAVTTGQGRMRLLEQVPSYRIRAVDLTQATEQKRNDRLDALRHQVFRRPGPSDRWPLVQIRAARLPGDRVRVFLGVDVLVCDAGSYWLIDRDLRHYYEHPDQDLPEVPITFAGCVEALAARRVTPEWARAADYWRARLATMPEAPALPTVDTASDARFVRHAARLDAAQWTAFKQIAAANGVTPTAALLTAYGELLAQWSADQRFAVTLTLFDRPALHPAIDSVVGDFTSLLLHEVDRRTSGSFADHAVRAHRTLFADLDHRLFSALDFLAEKAARTGVVASVPVVFTSALGLDDVIGGDHDPQWAGRQVNALSQTPQTVLDHQVIEQHGELLVQWDALEPVLDPADVDRMFDTYLDRLRALTHPEAWRHPRAGEVTAATAVPVDDVAITLRAGGDQTLFLVHPSGGDVTCYTDLALRLDERVTAVGLTDPGLGGLEVPTQLPALARLYVDVLRAIRPEGPYLLGGWSMGGSLGQEMACLLHEQGQHVALLLMLDSNDPTYITAVPGDTDAVEAQVLARHLGALEAYLDIDLGVADPAALAAFLAEPAEQRRALTTQRLRAHRLLGAREDPRTRIAVFERHLRGLALHQPRRHRDARTHTLLVRADRTATRNSGIGMGVDDTPAGLADLGWSTSLATPPETIGIDADHYSLMRPPAVAVVANLVNAALARVLP